MTIQEFRKYMASGQPVGGGAVMMWMDPSGMSWGGEPMLWIALEWWIWGFVALSNIFFVLGVVEVVCG